MFYRPYITVDIDNQNPLAIKSGDQAARNLSREVGIRVQGHLRLQSNTDYRRADRYYVKLINMPLAVVRNLAEGLRVLLLLRGDYRFDARRVGGPISPQNMLVVQNVTVRLVLVIINTRSLRKC
jgi:hypothetical protein